MKYIEEIHYHKENKTNGGKQIEFSAERQLQTSDHRFRAISALISAASPEKMDRYTKLRTTSGTTIIKKGKQLIINVPKLEHNSFCVLATNLNLGFLVT